jgi:hypothetical protein
MHNFKTPRDRMEQFRSPHGKRRRAYNHTALLLAATVLAFILLT